MYYFLIEIGYTICLFVFCFTVTVPNPLYGFSCFATDYLLHNLCPENLAWNQEAEYI